MHLNEAGPKKSFFVERKPSKTKEDINAGKRKKAKDAKDAFDEEDPALRIPDAGENIQEYLENSK